MHLRFRSKHFVLTSFTTLCTSFVSFNFDFVVILHDFVTLCFLTFRSLCFASASASASTSSSFSFYRFASFLFVSFRFVFVCRFVHFVEFPDNPFFVFVIPCTAVPVMIIIF